MANGTDNKNLEFNLPQNAYVNFDATSLKSYMIQQLNAGGVFTDQNFEGSNMSAILDILAYYTHVLMFYLNQTSSEAMFTQTAIYENMNRIVKLLDYKPTGKQTSLAPLNCIASPSLIPGNYNIRKYSYFLVDNIQYTFNNDFPFDKALSGTEIITEISDNAGVFQGTVNEYPIYIAEGLEYESFPVVVDNLVATTNTKFISHGTTSVYVKEAANNVWSQYTETDNLFLAKNTDRVVDIRLNENGHYEIKFGNGIFGKKLEAGDQVAVYYILSDGEAGLISRNTINGNKLFTYTSPQFEEIYAEVSANILSTQITLDNSGFLTFSNPTNSTLIHEGETVDEIRQNAPTFLSNQIRLVTESDYEKFLLKSIPNVLNSVKVVDNHAFIDGYIQYFYNICVDPNKVNRVIMNQVNFSDPCDFNNINVFCVPSFENINDNQYPEFLSNAFKNLIVELTKDKKIISNDVVPRDPIYIAFDLGFGNVDQIHKNLRDVTKLFVIREKNDKTSKEVIKRQVSDFILNYFNPSNVELGQRIDISAITSGILELRGVLGIETRNLQNGLIFDGISFITWNPLFEGVDENLINQNTILEFFKFPYLFAPKSLINKIEVIDQ